MKTRIYTRPTSSLNYNGKKIAYYEFLSSGIIEECSKSLRKMNDRINEKQLEINSLIENESSLSELDKRFYTYMLSKRKELILDSAMRILFPKTR